MIDRECLAYQPTVNVELPWERRPMSLRSENKTIQWNCLKAMLGPVPVALQDDIVEQVAKRLRTAFRSGGASRDQTHRTEF